MFLTVEMGSGRTAGKHSGAVAFGESFRFIRMTRADSQRMGARDEIMCHQGFPFGFGVCELRVPLVCGVRGWGFG